MVWPWISGLLLGLIVYSTSRPRARLQHAWRPPKTGRPALLSDPEVITLAILAQWPRLLRSGYPIARRYPSVIPACSVGRTVNGNWSMATPRSASGARSCLGRTSPLPLRGACELLRTPLWRSSQNANKAKFAEFTFHAPG